MKKLSLFFALIPLILVSCHNFHFEKRQHRKGYHLHANAKPKQSDKTTIDSVNTTNKRTLSKSNALTLQTPRNLSNSNADVELNTIESTIPQAQDYQTIHPGKLSIDNQSISPDELSENNVTKISKSEGNRSGEKNEKRNNNALYYFLLAIIVPFGFLNKKTERISRWATHNVVKTRLIIAVGVVAVLLISALLGHLVRYSVAPWMIFFSVGMILFSVVGYFISNKKRNGSTKSLNTRKLYRERLFFTNLFNVSAGFSAFALGTKGLLTGALGSANWNFITGWIYAPSMSTFGPDDEIQSLVKSIKILLILLLVFFLILIAILSCYLYCSYGAAIGTIVLVGGVLITVLGFALAILALKRIGNTTHTDDATFKKRKIRLTIALFLLLTLLLLAMIGVFIVVSLL